MPTQEDLKELEVICQNEGCGDPMSDADGNIYYAKRRMSFMGLSAIMGTATFKCLECGRERKFRVNPLTGNIGEV